VSPTEDGTLDPGWYKNAETLEREYAEHGTFVAMAQAHGGHESTYVKWWKRHGLPELLRGPKAGAPVETGAVELTVERLGDIAAALRSRGLDPDEWVVIRLVVNAWEGFYKRDAESHETVPLRQLKITLRPRLDMLLRPAETNNIPKRDVKRPRQKSTKSPRLVVFVGDEQAPYHDLQLQVLFREWLAANKPDEGVHLGDLMDLPTVSRHRPNPLWNASVQECVQAGYEILRGYVEASPTTQWKALPGNHDERLRDYQLQRAPELFGVRAADLDDRELAAAAYSLPALLHLDQLGISWSGSHGDYEHAQIDVSPELVARHGWVTGANSAEKTVRRLGLNVVVGHTHRQRVHYITEERRRETLVTLAVEAGCMCQVDGGLGYVINPDWQAGFAVATVWPDGSFAIDHATYRDGVLRWRDQRYEVARAKAA
jgi:hypothetical protein